MKGLAFAFAGGSAVLLACAVHDDTTFPNSPQPTETTPPARTVGSPLDDPGAGGVDPGGTTNTGVGPGDAGVDPGTSTDAVITGLTAGANHTCAVVNGAAMCWGRNQEGQLGDNTTTYRNTPVTVTGLETGVTSISAAENFTCAVVQGAARCWGQGNEWQLGDDVMQASSTTPVQVVGLQSGVTAIVTGWTHVCAIVNGAMKCWGANYNGQLGDDSGTRRTTPVQVVGLETGVTAIAAGSEHSCAVVNGGVQCWGSNFYGELGVDTPAPHLTPEPVKGLSSGVSAIVAGFSITCAIVDGAAQCWGYNENGGAVGDGTTVDRPAPVQVLGLTANVLSLDTSYSHSCAIVGGSAKCWGDNQLGVLGDQTTTDRAAPVQVKGLESGVSGVAIGYFHTCAVVAGRIQCWGLNTEGQLGGGTTIGKSLTPVQVQLP